MTTLSQDQLYQTDAIKANRSIKVNALALEILRNGPALMTMAEAVEEAKKRLG